MCVCVCVCACVCHSMHAHLNTGRRNKFIGVSHVNVGAPELKPVSLVVLRKRQQRVSFLDTRLALGHLRVFVWGWVGRWLGGWLGGWVGGQVCVCVCVCVCALRRTEWCVFGYELVFVCAHNSFFSPRGTDIT